MGTIHHALLDRGFIQATHVDATAAYLAVAGEEAPRLGHAQRVTFQYADFREVAACLLRPYPIRGSEGATQGVLTGFVT